MQKWEYVVKTLMSDYGGLKRLATELNRMLAAAGDQGWELFDIHYDTQTVTSTGTLGRTTYVAIVTFKRPKPPNPESQS